jgi:hypothetical protein
MSHIVTIKTQVRDAAAVRTACQRLGLPPPQEGTATLFSGQATGLIVKLPGWSFPVVCELPTATLKFDNYLGAWGEQKELSKFLQMYAVEKAKSEAHRLGHAVSEQRLADDSIKLNIQVQRGAA